MFAVEIAVCLLVLTGQRVMLSRPAMSNCLWLAANIVLAGIAWGHGNWGLIIMYAMLSASNIELLAKIAGMRRNATAP